MAGKQLPACMLEAGGWRYVVGVAAVRNAFDARSHSVLLGAAGTFGAGGRLLCFFVPF